MVSAYPPQHIPSPFCISYPFVARSNIMKLLLPGSLFRKGNIPRIVELLPADIVGVFVFCFSVFLRPNIFFTRGFVLSSNRYHFLCVYDIKPEYSPSLKHVQSVLDIAHISTRHLRDYSRRNISSPPSRITNSHCRLRILNRRTMGPCPYLSWPENEQSLGNIRGKASQHRANFPINRPSRVLFNRGQFSAHYSLLETS